MTFSSVLYENGSEGGHRLTPGQLVNAVAIALNVPAETVVQHDRNLVVAGLRTKGGRGHSAPKVTPLDAARLVVAVLGSARVLDSVETARTFEQAVYFGQDKERSFDAALMRLPDGHSFVEALAELIADASGPLQVEDPVQFLRRFSELQLSCVSTASEFSESPKPPALQVIATIALQDGYHVASYALNAQATDTLMTYRAYLSRMRREEKNNDRYKRLSRLYGIGQRRAAPGTAIMILGQAFRENGLSYETTQEAIADLLQSAAGKPKKRNAKRAAG
jgi:hypothetical protein